MADVLLTLIVPNDIAQQVADVLLSRPDLAGGFTASPAAGHGASIALQAPGEQVCGHAPRTQIQTAGPEDAMRAILALVKSSLPRAQVFYWLLPVLAVGHL